MPRLITFATVAIVLALRGTATAGEPSDPEAVLRALVKANEDRDLEAMARWMDAGDAVGYTIQGRKYVGWTPVARDMEAEFKAVTRLEIPIKDLQVWTRGDVAWFAMELDYIRYVASGGGETRTVMPLRDTGVLERRHGRWILVLWHESFRHGAAGLLPVAETAPHEPAATALDLNGQWAVQEEDKAYTATVDASGNGTYTHQGGRLMTTRRTGRKWQGTWQQGGNDREGGFDSAHLGGRPGGARGMVVYPRWRTSQHPAAAVGRYLSLETHALSSTGLLNPRVGGVGNGPTEAPWRAQWTCDR